MQKSKLVQLIDTIASRYADIYWSDRKNRYISIEYIFMAIMKLAGVLSTEKIFEHFLAEDYEELALMKVSLSERNITATRDDLRQYCKQPDREAEKYRLKIEKIAFDNALKSGENVLRADFYVDAICAYPNEILKKVVIPSKGENSLRKLYDLSRQKEELRGHLLRNVIGQDDAVNEFVDGVVSSMFFEKDKKNTKPRGFFVFAGPPGVGKTFLAEQGAESLGFPVKRFDMSEYTNADDSIFKLIGTDPTWRGHHEGELTSFMKACNDNKQGCFLVFDEIEKAHPSVIYLFLQILDAGRLTDKHYGYTVSFSDAFIVFTTNAGRSLYEDGKQIARGISKKLVIDALAQDKDPRTNVSYFPGAILSRFESGYTVMFRHLTADNLVKIGMKEMKRNADLFSRNYGPQVKIDKEIPFLVLLKKGGESDARSFRADCEKFICNNLIALGDAVHERKLNAALRKNNCIHFTVNDQYRKQLDKLLATDDEQNYVWVISQNKEHLEDIQYLFEEVPQYTPMLIPSVKEAIKGLKNDIIYPTAILFDMEHEDLKQSNTQHFASKNPVVASSYNLFNEFMECAAEEAPQIPIYMILEKTMVEQPHLEEALKKKGVTAVFSYEYVDVDLIRRVEKELNKQLQTIKLHDTAYRFARERKALYFTVSPNDENNEVAIRLGNFKKTTLVSGSDTNALISEDRIPNVTFKDYMGGESIKSEMREFIAFLKNPKAYCSSGEVAPKGVLLYGPPGTGKTFLAKALANEAGVPFFFANGSSFVNELAGSGPKAIRNLFATARKYAPSIVFIDEIDVIAKRRTGNDYNQAKEETLNMLLSEMDGFDTDKKRPVFVVAATNYGIDQNSNMALDAAIVRRFTRAIYVELPNYQERLDYWVKNLKKNNCRFSELFIESLAKRSVGMSYGEISNVIDKAVRDARKEQTAITENILDEALETIMHGEKRSRSAEDLERTAWHEAGHAFMSWKYGKTPEYITITARGDFGGYVMPAFDEEKSFWTKKEILEHVKICLAGRMSEVLQYGDVDGLTTGASQDIYQAGRLLTDYVCRYSMDDKLGLIFEPDLNCPSFEAKSRVRELLAEEASAVMQQLDQNKDQLQKLVDELLKTNKLTSHEIKKLMNEVQ